MSKQHALHIADNLTLPADVVTLTTAALGIRGSGKTNTAGVFTEELLKAGHQVIILDPLNVWWGLKSSADGKRDGYPVVILGGPRGDLPLSESDGRTVADFLAENRAPAILSMRHLTKSAQRRFVTDFAEQFYHRKGEAGRNTPVLLVVDEASLFVPQHVSGDSARMVGAIQSWVRQGRASGIGVMLVDQRPATVNKDVLSQIELMIVHRLISPQDRKALREWIDAHATVEQQREFNDTVATLARGEAWFWSPEWLDLFKRVNVRARATFDSSATPKLGTAAAVPVKLAAVELEALKGKLAATIERAKADDPVVLKREIAELKKQLGVKAVAAPPQRVEVPVVTDEQIERLGTIAEKFQRFEELAGKVREEVGDLLRKVMAVRQIKLPLVPSRPTPARPTPTTPRRTPTPTNNGSGTSLPEGERKILTVCAQYPDGAGRDQLTVLTGYKRSSRDTYIQRLRGRGYVDQRGDVIVATDEGVAALGDSFEPLPTGEELQRYWLDRLPEGERKVLEAVLAGYPEAVARETIDEATGYKRSSRDTYIQRLSSRRLVESVGRGEVRASADLFG